MPKYINTHYDFTVYTSPRVASTTLRSHILEINNLPHLADYPCRTLANIPMEYVRQLPDLGYVESLYEKATTRYSIMLWRDPVERFLSFVREFQINPHSVESYIANWHKIMKGELKVDHKSLPIRGAYEETDWTWWHLLPQTRIVGPADNHTHVFHVSEYNTGFRELLMDITGKSLSPQHARESALYRPQVHCSEEQIERIKGYYELDYVNFSALKA